MTPLAKIVYTEAKRSVWVVEALKNTMASRGSNLVAGEASESDEEYEINQSYFMKNTMVAKEETPSQRRGIVVEGEASESDEDEGNQVEAGQPSTDSGSVVVGDTTAGDEGDKQVKGVKGSPEQQSKRKVKFHYDS